MPIDYRNYPKNWRLIRAQVLFRAMYQCECEGICGLHQPGRDGKPRRCLEHDGEPGIYTRGKIVLTIAHLDHNPKNLRRKNLKALCQRCHNRYDRPHRTANAMKTRLKKMGQEEFKN